MQRYYFDCTDCKKITLRFDVQMCGCADVQMSLMCGCADLRMCECADVVDFVRPVWSTDRFGRAGRFACDWSAHHLVLYKFVIAMSVAKKQPRSYIWRKCITVVQWRRGCHAALAMT